MQQTEEIDKTIYIFIEQLLLNLIVTNLHCLNYYTDTAYCKVDAICDNIWSNLRNSKAH